MTLFRTIALGAFLLGGSVSSHAAVATLFDNLGNVSASSFSAYNNGPLGQSFLTGSNAATLTDVWVEVSAAADDFGAVGVGAVLITLNNDALGDLGGAITTLATVTDAEIGSTCVSYHISGLSASLAPNSEYWIAITDALGAPNGTSVLWRLAADETGVGIVGGYNVADGSAFSNVETDPFVMKILVVEEAANNNVDTPEPATLGLIGVAITALGYARRRRARAA